MILENLGRRVREKKIMRNEEKEVDANLRQKGVPREREEEGK